MLTLSDINGSKTVMQGAKHIATASFRDFRGTFDALWESEKFSSLGLHFHPGSCAFSYNDKLGTLRGLHYQKPPYGQAKLVTCTRGRVWDVIADLRPNSSSYLSWAATELCEAMGHAVYVPAGYAHGFITLTDNATVAYLIEGSYVPDASGVVRWNDTALGITWPIDKPLLTERDRSALDLLS